MRFVWSGLSFFLGRLSSSSSQCDVNVRWIRVIKKECWPRSFVRAYALFYKGLIKDEKKDVSVHCNAWTIITEIKRRAIMKGTAVFVRVTRGQTGIFRYRRRFSVYTCIHLNIYVYIRVCLDDRIEIIWHVAAGFRDREKSPVTFVTDGEPEETAQVRSRPLEW